MSSPTLQINSGQTSSLKSKNNHGSSSFRGRHHRRLTSFSHQEYVHFQREKKNANATALLMYLAPTITFKRIIRSRSTEQFSGAPYVITLLNCLLYCW
ncbi:hypothetical protein EUGRSUZ_F04273 [Eucalyptus grandis]|uniref:Uncharacterized protein n=2 Tax=Eucalyptus grandis TaxID=71139 RepID=A0ACC3KNY9_EUCGR|nr:hypothetical protein EUGRSUZ_F04273 [Eucalyptus grandis]